MGCWDKYGMGPAAQKGLWLDSEGEVCGEDT